MELARLPLLAFSDIALRGVMSKSWAGTGYSRRTDTTVWSGVEPSFRDPPAFRAGLKAKKWTPACRSRSLRSWLTKNPSSPLAAKSIQTPKQSARTNGSERSLARYALGVGHSSTTSQFHLSGWLARMKGRCTTNKRPRDQMRTAC